MKSLENLSFGFNLYSALIASAPPPRNFFASSCFCDLLVRSTGCNPVLKDRYSSASSRAISAALVRGDIVINQDRENFLGKEFG